MKQEIKIIPVKGRLQVEVWQDGVLSKKLPLTDVNFQRGDTLTLVFDDTKPVPEVAS